MHIHTAVLTAPVIRAVILHSAMEVFRVLRIYYYGYTLGTINSQLKCYSRVEFDV